MSGNYLANQSILFTGMLQAMIGKQQAQAMICEMEVDSVFTWPQRIKVLILILKDNMMK